jgi:hypothetical protein
MRAGWWMGAVERERERERERREREREEIERVRRDRVREREREREREERVRQIRNFVAIIVHQNRVYSLTYLIEYVPLPI